MKLDGEYLIYGEKSNQIVGAGLAGDKVRQALVGRFNYDYKGRYMLDFSFRYDGSSSFPKTLVGDSFLLYLQAGVSAKRPL